MKKRATIFLLLLCAVAATAPATVAQKTGPELLGVRLGMTEAEARTRLDKIGRWQEEKELRRDAVWKLKDKRYREVAVGFDKETRRVRYVTAIAREGGAAVRPADVIDVRLAKRIANAHDPAGNYKLIQKVAADKNRPGYVVTVFGTKAAPLTRLAIELDEQAGGGS